MGAFQALKFGSPELLELLCAMSPDNPSDDMSFGVRCARTGGRDGPASLGFNGDPAFRKDWDCVRAEVMYRLSRIKFASHADCREELLATGTKKITHGDAQPYWAEWNAKIMTRIREELRPREERDQALLDELVQKFQKEMRGSETGLPALAEYP